MPILQRKFLRKQGFKKRKVLLLEKLWFDSWQIGITRSFEEKAEKRCEVLLQIKLNAHNRYITHSWGALQKGFMLSCKDRCTEVPRGFFLCLNNFSYILNCCFWQVPSPWKWSKSDKIQLAHCHDPSHSPCSREAADRASPPAASPTARRSQRWVSFTASEALEKPAWLKSRHSHSIHCFPSIEKAGIWDFN